MLTLCLIPLLAAQDAQELAPITLELPQETRRSRAPAGSDFEEVEEVEETSAPAIERMRPEPELLDEGAAPAEDSEADELEEALPSAAELEEDPAQRSRRLRRQRQEKERQRRDYELEQERRKRNQTLLLGVLLLLLIWLLTRKRDEQQRTVFRRPSPITPRELGQVVFEALRSKDLRSYRSLFLTGSEASDSMDEEERDRYLQRRTPQILEAYLKRSSRKIPPGSIFLGVESLGDDQFAIRIKDRREQEHELPIGKAVRIRRTWRLSYPPLQLSSRADPEEPGGESRPSSTRPER